MALDRVVVIDPGDSNSGNCLTLEDLRKYDGKQDDGRIFIAINREIYDVTKGRQFYGPDGPYAPLAGRDATRALAMFTLDVVKDEWDDCSDLNSSQRKNVADWQAKIKKKYDYVGRLIRTDERNLDTIDKTNLISHS